MIYAIMVTGSKARIGTFTSKKKKKIWDKPLVKGFIRPKYMFMGWWSRIQNVYKTRKHVHAQNDVESFPQMLQFHHRNATFLL